MVLSLCRSRSCSKSRLVRRGRLPVFVDDDVVMTEHDDEALSSTARPRPASLPMEVLQNALDGVPPRRHPATYDPELDDAVHVDLLAHWSVTRRCARGPSVSVRMVCRRAAIQPPLATLTSTCHLQGGGGQVLIPAAGAGRPRLSIASVRSRADYSVRK